MLLLEKLKDNCQGTVRIYIQERLPVSGKLICLFEDFDWDKVPPEYLNCPMVEEKRRYALEFRTFQIKIKNPIDLRGKKV